jgi:hypothetical protein
MPSRFNIALKALRQLGPMPLALYALYKLGLKTGYYKRKAIFDKSILDARLSNITPLFSLPERASLQQILGKDGLQSLLSEADEIVAGNVRLFSGEPVPLELKFDQPLQHWTAYENDSSLITDLKSKISDLKYIWEPARFGWAFTLARAYHLGGDNKYAESFWKYFEIFIQHNPPNLGPQWMNGQEVALRLMALVWADHVFEASPASNPARRARLAESVADHAARIPPTLIYARSQNNNHLITEAAALYTAGLTLGHSTWRALGWRWLNWALRHQISGYGEYIQHSANYHRLMLQSALWVNSIKKDDWPHSSAQALSRATHWLFSMLDPVSGWTPNLGANDGSNIFPLSICSFADFRPVVQAAARAFLKTQMDSGVWDEMPVWLGLTAAGKTYEPEHYLGDNLHGRRSWATLRASRFRSRLSHMDQLHFDLWWRGLNVAQDAGTYLYNAEAPWDNALVSTRVHNTVMVDGREQMTRGGRFMTLDWFPAYSRTSFESDENILQRVIATHKGYRGLGVRHQRTVTVYADERWQVEDEFKVEGLRSNTSGKSFRLHWLLMDGEWEIESGAEGMDLKLRSPYGWITLGINVQPSNLQPFDKASTLSAARRLRTAPETSLVRAGELLYGKREVSPIDGWISPTYGIKLPALSLAVEVKSSQVVQFISEFTFPK